MNKIYKKKPYVEKEHDKVIKKSDKNFSLAESANKKLPPRGEHFHINLYVVPFLRVLFSS